jgi:hypothetical protein
MSVDPATAATNDAAIAATAAVQALLEVLQPAALPQHRLSLPTFWTQDLAGWFQHAEAEFTLARLPANSFVCYVHVIRALSSEFLTAVRDLTRDITATTPQPYLLLKDALLSHYCFPSVFGFWICRHWATAAHQHCLRSCSLFFPVTPTSSLTPSFSAVSQKGYAWLLWTKVNIYRGIWRRPPICCSTPMPRLPPPSSPLRPSPRRRQSMRCTRLLGGHSPACRRTAAVQSHLATVSPLHTAVARPFLDLPQAACCASTTTTSAARPAAANPPAPGREMSSGPGGTRCLTLAAAAAHRTGYC